MKNFGGFMKKILKTISLLALSMVVCLGFVGCGKQDSNSLAYSIEYNMDKMAGILNKTSEVKNEDIVIPELYSLDENKTSTNSVDASKNIEKTRRLLPTKNIPSLDKQIVSNEEIEKEKTEVYNQKPVFSGENAKRLTNPYYVPRRTSNVNYTNTNFNSYVGKVEDLYLMMNDAVCANNDACNCKKQILECCDILKALSKQIKSGEIELSQDQKDSCNNLLKELGKCTNKLTDTRNEVSNSCKSLSAKKSLSSGIDTLSSKYVTLINCLDNRISNYQNALAILKQLQCAITNTCYDTNLTDTLLDTILENNKNTDNKDCDNCLYDKNGNKCFLDENGKCYKLDENGNKCYICADTTCPNKTEIENNSSTETAKEETKATTEKNDSKKPYETKKVVDYEKPTTEKNVEEKKGNIDTFSDKTVKPNIIKKDNKKVDSKTEAPQKPDSQIQPRVTDLTNNNLPNNANTYGIGNGVYGTPVANGINNPVANGVNGTGIGNGVYGNGVYGNGVGIHNYENGVTNPYRNTDTYKFPPKALGGTYGGYGAVADTTPVQAEISQKPLPSENRQDFKTFTKIEATENKKKDKSTKIETNTLSKYDEITTFQC